MIIIKSTIQIAFGVHVNFSPLCLYCILIVLSYFVSFCAFVISVFCSYNFMPYTRMSMNEYHESALLIRMALSLSIFFFLNTLLLCITFTKEKRGNIVVYKVLFFLFSFIYNHIIQSHLFTFVDCMQFSMVLFLHSVSKENNGVCMLFFFLLTLSLTLGRRFVCVIISKRLLSGMRISFFLHSLDKSNRVYAFKFTACNFTVNAFSVDAIYGTWTPCAH